MVPKGEPATDFYMLEVSGIIRKTSESPLGRLHAKVTQGREDEPALAWCRASSSRRRLVDAPCHPFSRGGEATWGSDECAAPRLHDAPRSGVPVFPYSYGCGSSRTLPAPPATPA